MMEEPNLVIKRKKLYEPDFDELVSVLASGLKKYFIETNIGIMDCPDLTETPFFLARPGLGGGNTCLIDIGGESNLLPMAKKNKIYDILNLKEITGFDNEAFFVGAGAGPWQYAKTNCEGIFNIAFDNDIIDNQSRIAKIDSASGKVQVEVLPNTETKFAVLGNFFVSEGKPSKVLKIYCKNRISEPDFITCIRTILKEEFIEGVIGLGGAFVINSGKAKHHVMQDFSDKPIETETELNKWLKFFDFSAPLVSVGTLITDDLDLCLRTQHFHTFSNHNEGGHYHNDVTPKDAEYLAYFNVAKYLYRIDKPPVPFSFSKPAESIL